MQNMMITEDGHIQTAYGIFGNVSSYELYGTGQLKSVILSDKNMIVTHAGELVPAYTENERRKRKPSVEFFKSGMIKSVYLEEQQELNTPIGEFPAELVTFYETGEIRRLFPRDGKITGYWTEENERELQIPFQFDLGFTKFRARISCVCFYKEGDIRSITLFPGEEITVTVQPYGTVRVRNGIALYKSGNLKSCEPAVPTPLKTPVGTVTAFDPEAIGVTADVNSLCFSEDGTIESLITVQNRIGVQTEDDHFLIYQPSVFPAQTEEESDCVKGMKLTFDKNGIRFVNENKFYSFEEAGFSVLPFPYRASSCSALTCTECVTCPEQIRS